VSRPTLPRLPARLARAVQVVLAVLAIAAVLTLTAITRSQPVPGRGPSWRVLIVPDTTLAPLAYVPVPAGPPCPPSVGEGSR
jgi:hypothetical protein